MNIRNFSKNYETNYTPGQLIQNSIERYYPYNKGGMIEQITKARYTIKQQPFVDNRFQDFLNLQSNPDFLFNATIAPGLSNFNQALQMFNQ